MRTVVLTPQQRVEAEIEYRRRQRERAERTTYFTLADLRIQDKNRQIVAFVPNEVQAHYITDCLGLKLETDARNLTGIREIVLKARQFGFSTLILALYFLNTINNSNTNSVVIAHDLDATEKLFRIVSRYYQLLSEPKPATQYASKREIFWPSLGSRMSVETAGKSTAGRGDTIHNLHMSEWAFWDDPDVLTGLLQAVPRSGNIFVESTANGRENAFHTEYQIATGQPVVTDDGRSESVFRASFYAWFRHSEYQLPAPGDFVPTDEEQQRIDKFGLTHAQAYWHRLKRREPGMGHMMAQEYPSDDAEAFRATGGLYFDEFVVDGDGAHVVPPYFTPDNRPPAWYTYFWGVDPGFDDPWAFALCAMDGNGDIHVLESDTQPRLGESEQAQRIVAACKRWDVRLDTMGLAGADLWARKTIDGVPVEAPVEKYFRAGLNVAKAENDVISQWQRNQITREYVRSRKLFVYAGYNTDLIAALANAKHDPLPSRAKLPLHNKHSHPIFALGCAVGSWPLAAQRPKPTTTSWIVDAMKPRAAEPDGVILGLPGGGDKRYYG